MHCAQGGKKVPSELGAWQLHVERDCKCISLHYVAASGLVLGLSNALACYAVENMEDAHKNRHAGELLHTFEASSSEGFSVVHGYTVMSVAIFVLSIVWAVVGEGSSHFVWCFMLIILAALWLEPVFSVPDTVDLEEKRIVLRGPHETKHLINMHSVADVRMLEGKELWLRSIFAACSMTHCYVTDNTKAVLVQTDVIGQWQWSYIVSVTDPELFVLLGKEAAIVDRHEEFMRLTRQEQYLEAAEALQHTDVMKTMYPHFYSESEANGQTAAAPEPKPEQPEPEPEQPEPQPEQPEPEIEQPALEPQASEGTPRVVLPTSTVRIDTDTSHEAIEKGSYGSTGKEEIAD